MTDVVLDPDDLSRAVVAIDEQVASRAGVLANHVLDLLRATGERLLAVHRHVQAGLPLSTITARTWVPVAIMDVMTSAELAKAREISRQAAARIAQRLAAAGFARRADGGVWLIDRRGLEERP